MKKIINTDGGARGNPGPAGIGVVIADDKGNILHRFSEYIGETTNNQAEYQALVKALEESKKLGFSGDDLECLLDSELVVKQLNGQYKVKNEGIKPLFLQIHNLRSSFHSVIFRHIRREQNKEADRLVNEALDKKLC